MNVITKLIFLLLKINTGSLKIVDISLYSCFHADNWLKETFSLNTYIRVRIQ